MARLESSKGLATHRHFELDPLQHCGQCRVGSQPTQHKLRAADARHRFAAVIGAAILAPAAGAGHRFAAVVGAAEFAPAARAGHWLATIVVAIARDRRAATARLLLAAIGAVRGNRRARRTEPRNRAILMTAFMLTSLWQQRQLRAAWQRNRRPVGLHFYLSSFAEYPYRRFDEVEAKFGAGPVSPAKFDGRASRIAVSRARRCAVFR